MRRRVDPSAILESMAEGVYVVDTDRVITFWNPAARVITGYTSDEVTGRFCGDALLNHVDESGEPMCGSRCPLLETMRDGLAREARVYAHHSEGHLVPVRVSARPLRDEDGTITGAVETFTDDSRAADAESRLRAAEHVAMTDHLTGIGNRRCLEAALDERLRQDGGRGVAALVLDIDHFKQINDTYGHDVGDEVLTVVARTLDSVAGDGDCVVRLGGDEFVIVTSSVHARDVDRLAARVRAAVSQTRVAHAGGNHELTVSVGVALSFPGDTVKSLVKRADMAMLDAKRRGRNSLQLAANPAADSAGSGS